ncbi:MAG TPA: MBL fold metallo-hydrolase [Oceanospirillales bacterium]|nr:MBL fold metallo-hydrolase [Oceanospirillales bacterium]
MKTLKSALIISILLIICSNTYAHEHASEATYLGNEGIMIDNGTTKIIFDPFFHNGFNTYQLVPEDIRTALFNNKAPYNDIDAIFISHAHGDHFAADDMLKFLTANPQAKLIAPNQAVTRLLALAHSEAIKKRVTAIDLSLGEQPKTIKIKHLLIEAVRIPHAGWPARADISNLVFRVTLDDSTTIMHMGDADPNDKHFAPYKQHWQKTRTHTAFPPYWFFSSNDGPLILDERINTEKSIGIHVPMRVPQTLIMTDEAYFSKPGEVKPIK